jgi:hypothetical protein
MLSGLKYYWTIRRLTAELSRIREVNSRKIEKAKRDGLSGQALHQLRQELVFDEWDMEDQVSLAMSRRLCREAAYHRIPIPSHDDEDHWELSDRSFHGYFLTTKGFSELRAAVRKEKNDRWQS